MRTKDINTTKRINGSLLLTSIVNNQLVKRVYYSFTEKEAKTNFLYEFNKK